MKNTRKAFTLVELIVVITILAILGTIAFISLQGYSSDARNTKRTSDLGNISSKITTELATGRPLMSFIVSNSNNKIPQANISLAGTGLTSSEYTDKYNAGNPNYTSLGVKEENFKDPTDKQYVIAATSLIGGKYEVAASIEDGAGGFTAKVEGTYAPRSANAFIGDNTASVDTSSNLVVIEDTAAGFFRRGDTITGDGGTHHTTITKVSNDGLTLTVADTTGFSSGSTINIGTNETEGLIGSLADTTTPVVDGGADLPY